MVLFVDRGLRYGSQNFALVVEKIEWNLVLMLIHNICKQFVVAGVAVRKRFWKIESSYHLEWMLDQAVTRCNHNVEALDELRKLTVPVIEDDMGLFSYLPLLVGKNNQCYQCDSSERPW